MSLVNTPKAQLTNRFWKASLAWQDIGDWARGWTQESFIAELRTICLDQGRLGCCADLLLDTMIHDRKPSRAETPAQIIPLHSKTKIVGHREIPQQRTASQ